MAVVQNTVPAAPAQSGSDSGMGFFMGILLLIIFVILLLYYGLPILRGTMQQQQPQINVPGQIDVNVNQKK